MADGINTAPEMMQFEIVKHVTLPFFIMPENTPCFIKFNTAFVPDTTSFSERVRKQRSDAKNPQEEQKMNIATITNLQTGEEMRMVAHQVLKSNLDESYPENSYEGKMFKITKTEKKGGRGAKYYNFDIAEIRLKATTPAPNSAPAPAPAKQASAARR